MTNVLTMLLERSALLLLVVVLVRQVVVAVVVTGDLNVLVICAYAGFLRSNGWRRSRCRANKNISA